jgi:hypothetical protein
VEFGDRVRWLVIEEVSLPVLRPLSINGGRHCDGHKLDEGCSSIPMSMAASAPCLEVVVEGLATKAGERVTRRRLGCAREVLEGVGDSMSAILPDVTPDPDRVSSDLVKGEYAGVGTAGETPRGGGTKAKADSGMLLS